MSYFGKIWSATRPAKYHKFGNTNRVQESNDIVTKEIEAFIHDKNKFNKQKILFLILRLWIHTVKLNYMELIVSTWYIQ